MPDFGPSAAAQRFRTTGASVELEIKYTNTVDERAQAGNHKNVKATITATVQSVARRQARIAPPPCRAKLFDDTAACLKRCPW